LKVLITGGAGFIGSHTADLLLSRGYQVRILDSLEPPVHRRKEKPAHINEDIEFIIGDVRSSDDMKNALQGINIVIHLAAYQDYLTDFSKFAFVNDGGTAMLYEMIVNERLAVEKVILASSQAVYGEGKYNCAFHHGVQYPPPRHISQLESGYWDIKCPLCKKEMEMLPVDEFIVNPHNQYAVSKYAQELYAITLGRRWDIPTVVLRYSITQGPRQSFYNAYSGILRIFTLRILNNLSPIIYEDGKQLRDYVYVGDVASANLLAIESDATNYEIYNVGGGETLSVLEYAKLLLKVMGKDVGWQIPGKFRLGDTRHVISDISKLQKLGWEPKTPLQKIIREYVEWARAQPDVSNYYAVAEKVMRRQGVIRDIK
jgi:dTDP-L-rhamnose 4-epimerase